MTELERAEAAYKAAQEGYFAEREVMSKIREILLAAREAYYLAAARAKEAPKVEEKERDI
jgi:hypothetical protein